VGWRVTRLCRMHAALGALAASAQHPAASLTPAHGTTSTWQQGAAKAEDQFAIVFAAMGVNMETAHFFKQVCAQCVWGRLAGGAFALPLMCALKKLVGRAGMLVQDLAWC